MTPYTALVVGLTAGLLISIVVFALTIYTLEVAARRTRRR